MFPVAFTLVSTEDPTKVFAFGVEVIATEGEPEEAITFRREFNGMSSFGVHSSAEAAQQRFSQITPLTLLREGDREF